MQAWARGIHAGLEKPHLAEEHTRVGSASVGVGEFGEGVAVAGREGLRRKGKRRR